MQTLQNFIDGELVNSVEGISRAANLLKQIVLVEPPDWKPANI